MSSLTTCFRYWLLLLILLTLGACQRASYSFQASGSARQLLPTTSVLDSTAFPALAVPGSSLPAYRPLASQRRHQRTNALARRLPKLLTKLEQRLILAKLSATGPRVTSQHLARREPLPAASPARIRSKGIALLLAFFFGGIGAHLFYLGYYGRGAAYLIATAVGLALFIAAVIAAIVTLGSGAGFVALATIGAVISGVVSLLAFVDAIRIAIGDLKPKNGEYFPRFFQTHDK